MLIEQSFLNHSARITSAETSAPSTKKNATYQSPSRVTNLPVAARSFETDMVAWVKASPRTPEHIRQYIDQHRQDIKPSTEQTEPVVLSARDKLNIQFEKICSRLDSLNFEQTTNFRYFRARHADSCKNPPPAKEMSQSPGEMQQKLVAIKLTLARIALH